LENDAPISEDPFFLVAVMEKVNSPYLRGLPDFGNSLIGHDHAFNHRAVKAMLGHAFNMCHVKDTVENDKGRAQQVDLPSMFRLARSCGYRGYFSMEFETRAGDPVTGTKRLVEESLKDLS
jgi:sugar phosphate isomerase/epimerase